MAAIDTINKGKKIRDSIHGDIFLPTKFLALIDTKEFQRLRRIHQLAVAYLLFPGAEHTRFSHSIGTFFIMQKIISHFESLLSELDVQINERDKNVVLAAALLHDLGHGPFSHAFEGALPGKQFSHEEWTTKIITSDQSEIHKALIKFDSDFPHDVADLIKKNRDMEKTGFTRDVKKIDLFFILSSLVSSQLDADRMDYLLRDSSYAGVTCGTIDISRLISAMRITEYKNQYYVCILDKFTSDVEEYLLSRYQMHKGVYYHNFKREMEDIIKKILRRAMELYKKEKLSLSEIPEGLLAVFNEQEMDLSMYNYLDDSVLLSLFSKWAQAEDPILSTLCEALINRKKFKKLNILSNNENDIEQFKKSLITLLKRYNYSHDILDNEYFWIESKISFDIYKANKDNIWILNKNGTITDLIDNSKVIIKNPNDSGTNLNEKMNIAYISYDVLKSIEGLTDMDNLIIEINNLIKAFDSRNHIEIEKKYYFNDNTVFDKAYKRLSQLENYEITEIGAHIQQDNYYDTSDKYLFTKNCTLRFRHKKDKIFLTIKTPTVDGNESLQNERFEYEIQINNEDLDQNKDRIIQYLPEFSNQNIWESINRVLTIENNRQKYILRNKSIIFEVVFDSVTYLNIDTEKRIDDYQIEIELKSDYEHRVNLKMISDFLEEGLNELISTKESKYKRGLKLTI